MGDSGLPEGTFYSRPSVRHVPHAIYLTQGCGNMYFVHENNSWPCHKVLQKNIEKNIQHFRIIVKSARQSLKQIKTKLIHPMLCSKSFSYDFRLLICVLLDSNKNMINFILIHFIWKGNHIPTQHKNC